MVSHTSTTGSFAMLILFPLLPFLPKFSLSVTKAMLGNDGPDLKMIQREHFYSFSVCETVLLANPKETF